MSQPQAAEALPTQRRLNSIFEARERAADAARQYRQAQTLGIEYVSTKMNVSFQILEARLESAVISFGDEVMPLLIELGAHDELERDYWNSAPLGTQGPPELQRGWEYVQRDGRGGWVSVTPEDRKLNGLKSVLKFNPRTFYKRKVHTGLVHTHTQIGEVTEAVKAHIWIAARRQLDHFLQANGLGISRGDNDRPTRRIGLKDRWEEGQ
jgi:hypothetical protein